VNGLDSEALADVPDRLVAIRLDLAPICNSPSEPAITHACDVLQSAIEELGAVVHRVDGSRYLAPLVSNANND
jgi:hypothetical protein